MSEYNQWDEVSYVISSQYRMEILNRLSEGPATPSVISSDVETSITHVSRGLQELRELELVELLVSEDRKKGRVYDTTEEGVIVWNIIQEQNMA